MTTDFTAFGKFITSIYNKNIKKTKSYLESHPEYATNVYTSTSKVEYSPLHAAAEAGNTEAALLLLDYGADKNLQLNRKSNIDDNNKMTPLGQAYFANQIDTAFALREKGCVYNPDRPEQESLAFKSAIFNKIERFDRASHLESINAPKLIIERDKAATRVFDRIVEAINGKGGKLAKRIPEEKIGDKDNPEFFAFAKVTALAHSLASIIPKQLNNMTM